MKRLRKFWKVNDFVVSSWTNRLRNKWHKSSHKMGYPTKTILATLSSSRRTIFCLLRKWVCVSMHVCTQSRMGHKVNSFCLPRWTLFTVITIVTATSNEAIHLGFVKSHGMHLPAMKNAFLLQNPEKYEIVFPFAHLEKLCSWFTFHDVYSRCKQKINAKY